jgi:hypothetical protein
MDLKAGLNTGLQAAWVSERVLASWIEGLVGHTAGLDSVDPNASLNGLDTTECASGRIKTVQAGS